MTGAGEPEAVPRWGLGDAVVGFVVAQVVAGFVVAALAGDDATPPLGVLAIAQIGLWSGLLGIPVLASWRKGTGDLRRDFGLTTARADLGPGLALGILAQFVLLPLLYLPLERLIDADDISRAARDVADRTSGIGFALFALVVVIGAPIVEELFFRGLVLRSLLRRMGGLPASLLSGAWFALGHFELASFPGLVVFGALLAWLVVRTGRLGPAILAHVVFNAGAVAAIRWG